MTPAVIISIVVLALLVAFQMLLIAGLPLGHFAWGGQHKVLPRKLRVGSIVSILIYIVFGLFILSKADVLSLIPQGPFLDISLWVLFAYLALGVILNAVSRSKPERYTMTPTALLLAVCVFSIASS